MSWKTFWCAHIWKNNGDEVILRTDRELSSNVPAIGPRYSTYTYYSREQKCVKCGKERTIEKRKIHIA